MNPKLNSSSKMMKGIEWTLTFAFGFMVIRGMNPVWIINTEIFMPAVLPLSKALYIIYTVLLTGFVSIIAILLLVFGIGGCSELFTESMLKDMTTDKIEKLKIKFGVWIRIRSIIEDILLVYFSWTLDKHYLAILIIISAMESRWFLSVWNQLADRLKVKFYDDLQKEETK
jgi:hypothetical protein